jgi:hypothetical protein
MEYLAGVFMGVFVTSELKFWTNLTESRLKLFLSR